MNHEYAIAVEGLRKSFGAIEAVKGFSIQLKPGQIFGFLGPNGSGKTTTIRMLCGLLKIDDGHGSCLGYDIIRESYQIKLNVGYMTQKFSLYEDLTVKENLAMVGRLYLLPNLKEAVEETLIAMGLSFYTHQLARELSGGWKQRLALAACMLHKPRLLLLDEPTAGVDPQSRRDFWNQISNFAAGGVTVLVSTHYMDEVERCHEIAYILEGRLLVRGTLENVLANSGIHTWVATGSGITDLAQKLKELPGVEQLSLLGPTLRVSSRQPQGLHQALAPFMQNPNYTWQTAPPNAEDLFLILAQERQGSSLPTTFSQ